MLDNAERANKPYAPKITNIEVSIDLDYRLF